MDIRILDRNGEEIGTYDISRGSHRQHAYVDLRRAHEQGLLSHGRYLGHVRKLQSAGLKLSQEDSVFSDYTLNLAMKLAASSDAFDRLARDVLGAQEVEDLENHRKTLRDIAELDERLDSDEKGRRAA